jgi:hypothetical protein
MGAANLIFRTGDLVTITFEDRTVPGEVKFASKNGVSLMLSFEAILGGYVGMMPVLWQHSEFRDLLKGERVTIRRTDDDVRARRDLEGHEL